MAWQIITVIDSNVTDSSKQQPSQREGIDRPHILVNMLAK